MTNLFPREVRWEHVPGSVDFHLVETRRLAIVHFSRDALEGEKYLARVPDDGAPFATLAEAMDAAYDAAVHGVYEGEWLRNREADDE